MVDIKKDIEQLETAGELLDKNSPTGARLSLFLLDNLAELMMYKVVGWEFLLDDTFSSGRPPKYPARKRRKVITYFNDKVNFLVSDLKTIDSLQAPILKLGHRLRNEAYHTGILHEEIIIPFTRTYFQTVCELLPTLWSGGYGGWSGEVKEFLRKYGLDGKDIDRDTLRKVCQVILKGRRCTVSELSRVLSNDLFFRIQKTIDGLQYLPSDRRGKSQEEKLRWIQFREETDIEFSVGMSDEELRDFEKKVNTALSAFHPKVTLKTLEAWKKKAGEIRFETSHGIIIAKFNEIDQPFLKIENLVSEAGKNLSLPAQSRFWLQPD